MPLATTEFEIRADAFALIGETTPRSVRAICVRAKMIRVPAARVLRPGEPCSGPVISVQAAILHRFGQVLGRNVWRFVQVGDGAGDFQDTVMRARRETHF